jgi:group I intron endonuclease
VKLENHIVYQVTNTRNGKSYIGYTSSTLEERWKEHQKRARLGSGYHFHTAIRKHGASYFSPKILFVEETLRGAKETEILMILDRCPEYNKTMGGDGTPGHPMTDELKEKIRNNTPVRKGAEHPLFGVKRPDLVERNRNTVWTPELRAKQARWGESNPNFGKPRAEETKRRIAKSNTGKLRTQEAKERMSASAKRRAQTAEGKVNLERAKEKRLSNLLSQSSIKNN